MPTVKIEKMLLTNSSTAKQEENQKERGSCQTLAATYKIGGHMKFIITNLSDLS